VLVADLREQVRVAWPESSDSEEWRYALPAAGVPADTNRATGGNGLSVAGDWMAGEGSVPGVERGLGVGEGIGASVGYSGETYASSVSAACFRTDEP